MGALKAFWDRDGGKSYTSLARDLEAHFGPPMMLSGKNGFDATRLPALIEELQAAFNDRGIFDACIQPIVERLCEAKTCNIFGGSNIEVFTQHGDTLRQKLSDFIAARSGGDEVVKLNASKELADAFVKAVRTYQQVMAMVGPMP